MCTCVHVYKYVCVHVCVLDDGKESRVFATASTVLVVLVLVVYTTVYLTHIWFSDYDWFL